MLRKVALFTAVVAGLIVVPSAVADASQSEPRFTAGAAGIGDPYFPGDGNGGYDVAHYNLAVRYDPGTGGLVGVADIEAIATQNLSQFNLDLKGLSRIETVGTTLVASVGVAVLGAFLVLERRREYALLSALGATKRQLIAPPAVEGAITIGASMALGLPIGVLVAAISTRILSLLFTLPAPAVALPMGKIAVLLALVTAASLAALVGSIAAVSRVHPSSTLRES